MSSRALIRWVMIEGWGDEASGRAYRLATSLYPGDADGVYLPVLAKDAWSAIASRFDPRAAPESRATIGGLEVRLLATDNVCQGLFVQRPPARDRHRLPAARAFARLGKHGVLRRQNIVYCQRSRAVANGRVFVVGVLANPTHLRHVPPVAAAILHNLGAGHTEERIPRPQAGKAGRAAQLAFLRDLGVA